MSRGFYALPDFEHFFENGVDKPARKTKKAAGYDICSIENITIEPGTKAAIPTGLTSYMQDDEVLYLFVRSGLAYSKDLTLQNATGVIDADFEGGHIKVLLRNEGTEAFEVKVGDRIAQGVFAKFLVTDDDDKVEKAERTDGLGHTGV